MTDTSLTVRLSCITLTSATAFLMPELLTMKSHTAALHMADFHAAADFPPARRPACTPARSAASIMEASQMQLPPADARASVEVSTAAEAARLEEEGTDEHEASDADKQPKENEMMHGSNSEHKKCPSWRPKAGAALATFALLLAGPVQLCLSRPLDQTTFRSPEDASRALLAAVPKH